jgi:hypothetical protein
MVPAHPKTGALLLEESHSSLHSFYISRDVVHFLKILERYLECITPLWKKWYAKHRTDVLMDRLSIGFWIASSTMEGFKARFESLARCLEVCSKQLLGQWEE